MIKTYFVLFLIFLTQSLIAQKYTFTLGGNFTSGNLLSYGVNLRANLNSNSEKKDQIVFTPSFDYGKISNQSGFFELRRRELLSILNYERSSGIFKFYIYNEVENSFLRKISLRGSFGTGVSVKIITNEKVNFDISQFILPEIFLSSISNRRDNWALRLSTRLRFSKSFERIKYSSQVIVQPAIITRLSDGTPVSLRNNTNIRVNNTYEYLLSKNLSLGLTGDFVLQTYPSYNNLIKPYDTNLNLFIKGNF